MKWWQKEGLNFSKIAARTFLSEYFLAQVLSRWQNFEYRVRNSLASKETTVFKFKRVIRFIS